MPETTTLKFEQPTRKIMQENKGQLPEKQEQFDTVKNDFLREMPEIVKGLDRLREGANGGGQYMRPVNISLVDYAQSRLGFARSAEGNGFDNILRLMGVNPSQDTLSYLLNMADMPDGYRWLVPEIVREAVSLGLTTDALWPNYIAADEAIAQPGVKMPYINRSDARPSLMGEAQTFATGTLSFAEKNVKIRKMGVGLKVTDEVVQYSSLNLVGIYFRDMGIQMNMGLDLMLIDTLINGDGNANGAPVVGVSTPGTLTYKDMLRVWIRMSQLGKKPDNLLSNENMALDVLSLNEFTNRQIYIAGSNQQPFINFRTPVPQNANYDIHGGMPVNNQILMVDKQSAVIKFTAQQLKMESARIAERQMEGTYASTTTGFAILFRDGRIVLDRSLDVNSNNFPSWMNAGAQQAAAAFYTA